MKRIFLNLVLASSVCASGMLTSCDEKPKTVAKTETKPATNSDTTATTTVAPADTAATVSDTTTATNSATTVAGSAQKFGHINSADLIDLMPEKKKADANLEAFVRSLEGKLGNLQ